MLFNSYIFIIIFLPIFIITYHIFIKINPTYGKIILVIGSAIFYIYGGWKVTAILGISILINYGTALIISHSTPPPSENYYSA